MSCVYYRIGADFLGAFIDGAEPSQKEAVVCPIPSHGLDKWVDGKWVTPESVLRAQFKEKRAALVREIKVEVNGMTFDGDEISQGRMARSLVGLEDGEMITWVLADNTSAQVSKNDLREALRLAGVKQAELWIF